MRGGSASVDRPWIRTARRPPVSDGSEGTLALVTQATLKLVPLLRHSATLLSPFRTLAQAAGAVPALIVGGVGPLLVEYIDGMTRIWRT